MTFLTNQLESLTVVIDYDVGKKRAGTPNQDYVGRYTDIELDPSVIASKGRLFVLADGMGGAAGGEIASQMAVKITLNSYYQDSDTDIFRSLEQAIQTANTHIYERSQADVMCRGMGTTIVAVVVREQMLYVAHVGDSRAYLFRARQLHQLTTDHSLVQAQVEAGLLSAEEALTHPQRNVISRNLGSDPKALPDFGKHAIQPADTILLCSDGLWEEVDDNHIATQLVHAPKIAAHQLVNLANANGGKDNISLMIIHVDAQTPAMPEEKEVNKTFGVNPHVTRLLPETAPIGIGVQSAVWDSSDALMMATVALLFLLLMVSLGFLI